MSLARQHFQRMTAAAVSAATAQGAPVNANAYELQLIALADAKRALKQVQSIERKVEVKRRVLPDFAPWVRGVLEAGRGGQDDVVLTVMVWLIDVGDFGPALDIAAYALEYGLALPDQYKRDVATWVAEEIAEQAFAAAANGTPVDLPILQRTEELTADHDMPDEVRAKLHKAIGQGYQAQGGTEQAIAHLKRALQLYPRAGVKKDVERLERALKA